MGRMGAKRRLPTSAIVIACAVTGALQALHALAYAGELQPAGIAFAIATTAIVMIVLANAFRTPASARALVTAGAWSMVLGIACAFAARATHAISPLPARIVAQIGAFDGLLALGLWAVAVVVPAVTREANVRTLELEQLRVSAELATLRAHLQPHFLLNTLTTISGLVARDPEPARELIAALGDLLRDSLEGGADTHTLAEELAWLRRYARVIEMRHRVRFSWDIAEAATAVRVPRMLLQPLVENAVKHGALRCFDGGEVRISARASDGKITCVIEDNGPTGDDSAATDAKGPGLGLSLVERRLELELAGRARFRLERAADRTRSIVELPVEQ